MADATIQLLGALAIDAAIGYPQAVYRRIRHPVVWMGSAISLAERRLNHGGTTRRKLLGCMLILAMIAITGAVAWLVQESVLAAAGPGHPWLAIGCIAVVGSAALAQRSLYEHVHDVAQDLAAHDLPGARAAVSKIVGRDTATLDESGVSAAAIESLAESFCDGIVAPAFWFLVGGLPGVFIYKAVNTADSLIGHKEERYRAFGWAAARTDDLMNLVPARIAGLFICIAGAGGFRTMVRDASRHSSPNAGWTEAALAGALGHELGGHVSYDNIPAMRPTFGSGPRPTASVLARSLRIYILACALLWLTTGALLWLP